MVGNPFSGTLREIAEDASVSSAIDSGFVEYPRLEEAWNGLKWLLARSADRIGQASRDGQFRLYIQPGDAIAGVPEIWVLYEATPDRVAIRAINLTQVKEDAAGS